MGPGLGHAVAAGRRDARLWGIGAYFDGSRTGPSQGRRRVTDLDFQKHKISDYRKCKNQEMARLLACVRGGGSGGAARLVGWGVSRSRELLERETQAAR